MTNYYILFCLLQCTILLMVNESNSEASNVDLLLLHSDEGYIYPVAPECFIILNDFAQYLSDFTKCSILYARPIKLCESCIEQYINFQEIYKNLSSTIIDGHSCLSSFVSHDRLNAVLEYYEHNTGIWNKAQCTACYTWLNSGPVLSNETIRFNILFNETRNCILKYNNTENNTVACDKCMQNYLQLDNYYKTLSADAVGVDNICMDIVDAMNATRYTWSKTLNCCKMRRTPEIIFLSCASIISILPLFYYIIIRFCSPIRDFPNALKQSRFKQTILRALNRRTN